MRPGGGKTKGSAFEREVCKRLSLWVTAGERTDVFWRSAMSGGRATVQRRKGVSVRQTGDITAVAPEGHYLTNRMFIECKHVHDLAIASFVMKGTGQLASFWKTACIEAKRYSRSPMLIARQNNMPAIVLVRTKLNGPYCEAEVRNSAIYLWEALLQHPYTYDVLRHYS